MENNSPIARIIAASDKLSCVANRYLCTKARAWPERTWSIWPSWRKKIRKGATIVVHNLKESKEICRKAIDKYGETAQIYLAMVEARYLAQALQRYLDCQREGAEESKLEESRSKRAKVKLMLTQLDFIFGTNREAELAELSRMEENIEESKEK